MTHHRAGTRRAAWLIAGSLALAAGTLAGGLHAQGKGNGNGTGNGNGEAASNAPAFEDTLESLSADLTVRQSILGADGKAAGAEAPGYTMRLDRRRQGNVWRTAITLRNLDRAAVMGPNGLTHLDNPFIVARFEYDDDGTPARMFDVHGRLMKGPTEADRQRLGLKDSQRNKDWDPAAILGRAGGPGRGPSARPAAAGLVAATGDREKRRGDLEKRFGARVGKVRGLDQFVQKEGRKTRELLVSPDSSLPIEVNELEDGRLVSHSVFGYEAIGTDVIARTHARSERLVSAAGTRVVTDISIANVVVRTRGAK